MVTLNVMLFGNKVFEDVAKIQIKMKSWWNIGEGNGSPLQYPCLENPMDGEDWWAAVYGVAQSRTRLKRLSSSSKEYWSGLLWPPPGDLPNPGIKLASLTSPVLTCRFFTVSTTWETWNKLHDVAIKFLSIGLNELKTDFYTKTCIQMLTTTLFKIANIWEQPRCPTVGD